jgi:hypothetical protein
MSKSSIARRICEPSPAAIGAAFDLARGTSFHDHPVEAMIVFVQALPNPPSKIFQGRYRQSLNIVQILVVEFLADSFDMHLELI